MSSLSLLERRIIESIGLRAVTMHDVASRLPMVDELLIYRTVWSLISDGFLRVESGRIIVPGPPPR